MTLQEQYNTLLKYRKNQSIDIISSKKRKIWEFFRNIVPIKNLEQNLNRNFSLYYAPLKQIRGVNMTCWPIEKNSIEIYQDENFVLNNPNVAKIQTTHEVLHALSQMKNENQYIFGHQYPKDKQCVYSGIDEATTQLFAEDIELQRLNEEEDYLYFIKNIMRVMKVIFGIDNLANQYLNNNNQFEINFNKITNNKFDEFVSIINEIYILSKNKQYSKIKDDDMLDVRKEQILSFTKELIQNIFETNHQLMQLISVELQDQNFLNKLNVKTSQNDIKQR